MTHSLHRKGTIESLKKDYVILAMLAKDINDKLPNARQKLLRVAEIMKTYNPTNMLAEKAWKISSVIQATFTNVEDVKKVVKALNEEDLGISIVISGLISNIRNILEENNLKMHTVHLSLGTFGKKDLLPSPKILEITSMCGHHCISPQLVEYYLELIRKGKISIQIAAKQLEKPCICGIFNTSRAEDLLNALIEENC